MMLSALYYIQNKSTTVDLIKTEVFVLKKSSFVAMLLGTVSGVLFALGMCMALIPEWNSFQPGIVFGCAGLLMGVVTIVVWRKMEHKQPFHISGRTILTIAAGIVGALALGLGMCFSMVWDRMTVGIGIGLAGIVVMLCLVPLTKGIDH